MNKHKCFYSLKTQLVSVCWFTGRLVYVTHVYAVLFETCRQNLQQTCLVQFGQIREILRQFALHRDSLMIRVNFKLLKCVVSSHHKTTARGSPHVQTRPRGSADSVSQLVERELAHLLARSLTRSLSLSRLSAHH